MTPTFKFPALLLSVRKANYLNRWVVFCLDSILSLLASIFALSVLSFIFGTAASSRMLIVFVGCSFVASSVGFLLLKTYKNVIRHSTFTEVSRIAFSSFIKILLLYLFLYSIAMFRYREVIVCSLLDFCITFFFLSFFRAVLIFGYRYLVYNVNTRRERLLIYYDPTQPETSIASLLQEQNKYKILGYIQYGKAHSMRLSGYSVFQVDSQETFDQLRQNLSFTALLFPNNKAAKRESDRFVRFCEKQGVKMLLLPAVDEFRSGKKRLQALPEIRIEDLLGRDEIKINMEEIHQSLRGKVVMVTGAAGSIGSELCRQLCTFDLKELILFDSAETPMHNIRLELEDRFPNVHFEPVMGDIRMVDRLESVFSRFRPQYVFHAAAYKHVPLMEENPCEAVHTNVFGTRLVANMAVKYGVDKFIMVSTDKAVNPTNVMGASKRLAEIYVQSLSIAISRGEVEGHTRFITTRFGNVLGSNGSVIPRFREQLAKGGPLTVTHPEIIRYFMTIPEACRLVLEAAFMGKGNEIFVFDMGTPVKIADLARRMIELAGLRPGEDIEIKYTGLRPGEKLYEELLATKENTLPTENKQIYRAQVREYNYHTVDKDIDTLTDLAIHVKKMETVREMKRIVPEFKSKNSVYEALDKE